VHGSMRCWLAGGTGPREFGKGGEDRDDNIAHSVTNFPLKILHLQYMFPIRQITRLDFKCERVFQ